MPHVYVPLGVEYRAACTSKFASKQGADERASIDASVLPLARATPVAGTDLSTMQAFHDQGLELWALGLVPVVHRLGGLALLLAVVGVYGVK